MLAALALSAAQHFWVTPLVLEAEALEEAHPDDHAETGHDHTEVWHPEDGWQRTLATAASNCAMCVGFALMLCGAYTLRPPIKAWHGLGWGAAGYVVFFAAPSLGLPPDLPGTASAGLYARQAWWLGTAFATALGLALLLLQPHPVLRAGGALALALPHLIGAPHPVAQESLASGEMQAQFQAVAFSVNAVLWLMLGLLTAAVFMRFARRNSTV